LNLWWNLELADIPIACKQHWPKKDLFYCQSNFYHSIFLLWSFFLLCFMLLCFMLLYFTYALLVFPIMFYAIMFYAIMFYAILFSAIVFYCKSNCYQSYVFVFYIILTKTKIKQIESQHISQNKTGT
jgi:hypothetical protein